MSGEARSGTSRIFDPLPASVAGTMLATVGNLAWPDLASAVLCLAVLVTTLVWIRSVNALRNRAASGFDPRRLYSLGIAGVGGWSGVCAVAVISPSDSVWPMMAVAATLWPLSRAAGVSA